MVLALLYKSLYPIASVVSYRYAKSFTLSKACEYSLRKIFDAPLISAFIDGRGNRGQLFKLSVGHKVIGRVRRVGNPVHVWFRRAYARRIMMKSEELKASAKNNTEKDFKFAYFDNIDDALIEGLNQNQDFFSLLLGNDEIKKEVLGIFAEEIYRGLRAGE